MQEFTKYYNKLNKEQRQAVDEISGPVMVVAGPGTGKTQVLTLRIANILKNTDTQPNQILALTFTESAAQSMQQRLSKIIGKDAYAVNISTFHGFASSVILENPDEFLMNSEYSILSDIERLSTIHKIIDTTPGLNYLKPTYDNYFYASCISKSISDLKREGITYLNYKKLVINNLKLIRQIKSKDKKTSADLNTIKVLQKQLELKKLYKAYEKEIKLIKRYDFEDIINFVNLAFVNNEALLKNYQEKFLYFLVDEFQDTNNAQYNLLLNLTSFWGKDSDIFVVGDDDQAIYRFQGASVENMLNFVKDFSEVKIINLINNYRSSRFVLEASQKLISNNTVSLVNKIPNISKKLISNLPEETNKKIKFYIFSNGLLESYFVAQKIKKLIAKGTSPSEIAVIYRNNSDSEELEECLSKKGVFYNIEGENNVLESMEVKKLLKLFQVIEKSKNKTEDIDLFTLLNYKFLNFDYTDNLKIARYASERKINLVDAILQIKDRDNIVKDIEKYKVFLNKITHFISVDAENVFTKTFETVLNESGYLNFLLKSRASVSSINKINSLYSEVQRLVKSKSQTKIKDFLDFLEVYYKNNLKIPETTFDLDKNSVTLTTCHKAKGREFSHVFIYRFVDKKWGNNRNVDYIKLPQGFLNNAPPTDVNEDERRLFYVALTRTKTNLYITNSKKYSTGYGSSENSTSMFLLDLPKKYIATINTKKIETKNFIKRAAHLFLKKYKTHKKISKNESDLLTSILSNFKLSVTALNTYLECPYKFKLNNILKTPRAKAPYLVLGTAVHKALEELYKHLVNTGTTATLDFLIARFLSALNNEIVSEKDFESLKRRGKNILSTYYKMYKNELKKPEYLERNFGYGFGRILMQDGTGLVGKVDRIDLVKELGGVKYVKIIDYKTGKIKSKKEIEGSTKNSDGALKRQLVFYKILCDMDKSFNYKASEFELDFVGTGNLGEKPKKYVFNITPEEVSELKELILQTMLKIRSHKFNRISDIAICSRCDYYDHCYPNGIPKVKFIQGEFSFK